MSEYFFESQNTHFVLVQDGRTIILYRGEREIWQRNIDFNNFEIVGIGNNGHTVLKAEEGIVIYPAERHESERIIPGLDKKTLEDQGAFIAKARLSQTGDRLCLEKVSVKTKLSEKLFRVLASSNEEEKGQYLHEMIYYNISTGKQKIFYQFSVDRQIPHAFVWDSSPDLENIIWGEASKVFRGMETRFSVANMRTDKVIDRFVLEGVNEWILKINNFGNSVVDSPQKTDMREIIISTYLGEKIKMAVSSDYSVEHIGRSFIVFRSRMEPRFLFKNFEHKVIENVDLSAIEEMDMDYDVVFSPGDDIHIIVRREDRVKVVHSNLERFATDAKRWRIMAEQRKIDTVLNRKKEILQSKEHDLREKKVRMKTEELMKTVEEQLKSKKMQAHSKLHEKEKKLKQLREQFKAHLIGKYEYVRAKKALEEEIAELQAQETGTVRFEKQPTRKIESSELRLTESSPTKKIDFPVNRETGEMPQDDYEVEDYDITEDLANYTKSLLDEELDHAISDSEGGRVSRFDVLETEDLGSSRIDQELKLLEVKKQIEMEVQEAVRKKSEINRKLRDQQEKYQKLLKEIEESYRSGMIMEENYNRLKNKYLKSLENINQELEGS